MMEHQYRVYACDWYEFGDRLEWQAEEYFDDLESAKARLNEYAEEARNTGYCLWEQSEMYLKVTYEAYCNEYLVDNDDEEGEYEYEYDGLGEEYLEVTITEV